MPGYLSDQGLVLANTVLDYFEQHPEEHLQETWWCESGCCFAGGLARAVGATPRMVPRRRSKGWEATTVNTVDGLIGFVGDVARDALGLDEGIEGRITSALFASGNTLNDLRRMVADLADGNMIELPPLDDEDDDDDEPLHIESAA